MFKPALHENYNTFNFERVKIENYHTFNFERVKINRSLRSVTTIMPCHYLYLRFLSFSTGLFILLLSMSCQVEFSASYSSACIRSSQQFPELSITYASS